jgi:hypothetical protein
VPNQAQCSGRLERAGAQPLDRPVSIWYKNVVRTKDHRSIAVNRFRFIFSTCHVAGPGLLVTALLITAVADDKTPRDDAPHGAPAADARDSVVTLNREGTVRYDKVRHDKEARRVYLKIRS